MMGLLKRGGWCHVIPGSVLSPWCGLCFLHPLCSAWSCCNTSRSRAASGSESPPDQSQTPEENKKQKGCKNIQASVDWNTMTGIKAEIRTRMTKIMRNGEIIPPEKSENPCYFLKFFLLHTSYLPHNAEPTNIPCNYVREHPAYGLHIVLRPTLCWFT